MLHKRAMNKKQQAGLSLVEMMVAMMLGLIVLLAAGGSFLASQKVSRTAQALSRNQESSRLAFEMLARDARVAGVNPCSSSVEPINILNSGATNAWWLQWMNGIRGYDGSVSSPGLAAGSGAGDRIASSPVLDIYTADDQISNMGGVMTASNAAIPLATGAGARFSAGDLVVACDTTIGFLFQATAVTGDTIAHGAAAGAPGNCSGALSASDICTTTSDGHRFGWDGQIGKATGYRWYLGPNEAGTRSLWRARLTNKTTGTTPTLVSRQEIARGVDTFTVEYLQKGATDYTNAAGVTNWKTVSSLRITLGLKQQINQAGATIDKTLEARTSQIIALRNR